MITNIELNQSGIEKFNTFFASHAREGISMQTIMLEVLSTIEDRAGMNESLIYELGRRYTVSGNPELLIFEPADITVTEEDDE